MEGDATMLCNEELVSIVGRNPEEVVTCPECLEELKNINTYYEHYQSVYRKIS